MYWAMMSSKLFSARRPSALPRTARTPAGQLATMPAMRSSRCGCTSARTRGPATRSSASSICCTVTLSPGMVSALRPTKASRVAS
jgi:hypothetical protein